MDRSDDSGFAIRIGLLAVVGFMSWPVWLAVVSGMHAFTWTVAASALVPLLLTLLPAAFAVHAGARLHHRVTALEHRLHIDSFLDSHLHRHA
jgi:hypothetical protein